MNNFYERESQCEAVFAHLGTVFHLWTNENFEIIFTSNDDFKAGMNIVGLCAGLFPDLKIITFELMSNHVHFTLCGTEENVVSFFNFLKKHLVKYFRKERRTICWDNFVEKHRVLHTLNDARNVIVYNNRNGFLVNENHTPYTYPWGANRYYFNPELRALAMLNAKDMPFQTRRACLCSHVSDRLSKIPTIDGYAIPTSFCKIEEGERLFISASNYFYRLGKNVESMKEIAREIGENIYYTDDELFSSACAICKQKYGVQQPGQLSPTAKLEMAKTLRFEYNASAKQIARILRLPLSLLSSIGING